MARSSKSGYLILGRRSRTVHSMDGWEAIELLATGALRGDEGTARDLLGAAAEVLRRRATRRCWLHRIFDYSLREEAAQNALARVWRYRDKYRGNSAKAFNGWFKRICRSAAYATANEHRHEATEPADAEKVGENGPDAATRTLSSELVHALKRCLNALQNDDGPAYDVLSLVFFLGATEREAASVLDLPKATAHTRKRRALEALAGCLEVQGVAP